MGGAPFSAFFGWRVTAVIVATCGLGEGAWQKAGSVTRHTTTAQNRLPTDASTQLPAITVASLGTDPFEAQLRFRPLLDVESLWGE